MSVETHVFTDEDGSQHLLCVFPDGRMTLAHRSNMERSWGLPVREDKWYQKHEVRSIEEVRTIMSREAP